MVKRNIGFPPCETHEVKKDLKDMIGDLIPFNCSNAGEIPFTTVPSSEGKRLEVGDQGPYSIYDYISEEKEVYRECIDQEGDLLGEARILRKPKPKSQKQKDFW